MAAKEVGLGSGSDAEKALKALKAADDAVANGSQEMREAGERVKDALNKRGVAAATRAAVKEGLLPPPQPRKKKAAVSANPVVAPAEEEPLTPTGVLAPEMKKVITRERRSGKRRVDYVAALYDMELDLTETCKAAQRDYKKLGCSVIRLYAGIADKALQRKQEPGIEATLRAVAAKADKVAETARMALYLYQFIPAPGKEWEE